MKPIQTICSLILFLGACAEPYDKGPALRRADRATQDKRFEDAREELNELLEHDPSDIEAHFKLGLSYALDNQPIQARLSFLDVVVLDSTRADALEQLGMLAFAAEERKEAIEMLERSVRAGTRKGHVYDTLSYLHFQEGTIDKAKHWIRNAIRANPDARFRMKLATLDHFIGSFDEARDQLESLAADYPQYYEGKLLLGRVYRQLGENEKALATLNEALEHAKGHPDHFFELGMARLKTNDPDGAIEAFEKVLLVDPGHTEARYGMGQAYTRKGDRQKARLALDRFKDLEDGEKELKADQESFIAHWQDGVLKEKEGDLKGAYQSLKQAAMIKEGDIGTHVMMWMLQRRLNDPMGVAREREAIQRQLALESTTFDKVALSLAGRLRNRGFKEKAGDVLLAVLEDDPTHAGARYQLARVYESMGKLAERDEQFVILRQAR